MWKITASLCNYKCALKWQRPTHLAGVHYFTRRNEIKRTKRTGTYWPHSAYLDDRSTDSSIEPHPVESRDDSIPGNRTEDDRTQPLPLLREVIGMDLSKEHGQDHSKHGDQVYLTPILERKDIAFQLSLTITEGNEQFSILASKECIPNCTYFGIFTSKHNYLPSLKQCTLHTIVRSLRMTNQTPKWGVKEHIYSHKSITCCCCC